MSHLKALDGIRGIAILLVMCFHFGYLAPGWVGVQIFFTLSGYLITGILLQSRDKSCAAFFADFYWHRAVRILPLLYFFILICVPVYAISGSPATFGSDWPWLAVFAGNFARMRPTDLGPSFVHLWSLAVEQQFYLIWPVLLYFLPPRTFRTAVAGVLLLTPLLRLMLFQWLVHLGYDQQYAGKAAYVLPFTQFDAFAAGAAIPLWNLDRIPNAGRWLFGAVVAAGAAGFAVLLTAYLHQAGAFIFSFGYAMYLVQGYGYVWGYSLLNILSMLWIVHVLQAAGASRWLAARPLTWIGRISFGMYVYHVPLLLLANALVARLPAALRPSFRLPLFITWLATVLLVSETSYRWIERPFLKLKNQRPGGQAATAASR